MKSTLTRTIAYILVPLFTLVLGWQLGVRSEQQNILSLSQHLNLITTGSGSTEIDPEAMVDLGLFWDTWRVLQTHYVDPEALEPTPMLYGAIAGMVDAVGDPYTLFMTPVENTDFRDSLSGHLQGIGAELTEEAGQIVIVTPIKGSPAERAGLLPEDIIVEVDGEDIAGQRLNEVVSKVRGPKGTKVTIKVLRAGEGDLLTFTITRDDITVPSTEYEVKQDPRGDIGYLAINQFGAETVKEVRAVVEALDPDALKGLIIDLRFNGGGYLDGSIEIASMFLEGGNVVTVAGRKGVIERHDASGKPIQPDIPLVILQNQASASASEILAGALQDHDRATIIGMQSYGKGTVQEVVDLDDGTSLRVTVAKWLTPDGHDLGKQGVTPDIEVDRTREDVDAKRDPQLDAAMLWLLEGEKYEASSSSAAE